MTGQSYLGSKFAECFPQLEHLRGDPSDHYITDTRYTYCRELYYNYLMITVKVGFSNLIYVVKNLNQSIWIQKFVTHNCVK